MHVLYTINSANPFRPKPRNSRLKVLTVDTPEISLRKDWWQNDDSADLDSLSGDGPAAPAV